MAKGGWVYLLTNADRGVFYVGVTNDLVRRVLEHRNGIIRGFTWKYNLKRLVWFEGHPEIEAAIVREKRIKRWPRAWKIALVEGRNPHWFDLYEPFCRGEIS